MNLGLANGRSFYFLLLIVLSGLPMTSAIASPVDFAELLARDRPTTPYHLHYGNEPDQFGELWLPATSELHPVVVMIHGGCWQENLPGLELMDYIADDLRRNNIAVWNIEYRRLGVRGAGYPGTFLDIGNGVDYLRQIAETYKLDLSQVVFLGHSAGGHLALWAAARHRLPPKSALYINNPLAVKAVVSLAGISDLATYHDTGPEACGGPSTIDHLISAPGHTGSIAYSDTSPASLLPLGVEQLVASGELDPIVPARFGGLYGNAAQQAGDNVDITNIPYTGHFEFIDPKSKAWAQIKSYLLDRLR